MKALCIDDSYWAADKLTKGKVYEINHCAYDNSWGLSSDNGVPITALKGRFIVLQFQDYAKILEMC